MADRLSKAASFNKSDTRNQTGAGPSWHRMHPSALALRIAAAGFDRFTGFAVNHLQPYPYRYVGSRTANYVLVTASIGTCRPPRSIPFARSSRSAALSARDRHRGASSAPRHCRPHGRRRPSSLARFSMRSIRIASSTAARPRNRAACLFSAAAVERFGLATVRGNPSRMKPLAIGSSIAVRMI